jgi:L,D-peptidoglycan transpeptidase YkuD (ErfK/YbiS/YcfS/YnhG family)
VYDVIAVLGWNDAPVERGRGSAIFLHVARPDWAATEGCVALALPDLLEVLEAGLSTVITG